MPMFEGADELLDALDPEIDTHVATQAHTIIRVAPENITPLWSQVEPLIESVIRLTPTHTCEDVRLMLMSMRAHLWAQWGSEVEALFVTEFVTYPQGAWLRFWIAAAHREHPLDLDAFINTLRAFGVNNGCRGFEWCGRVGWMRERPMARFEGTLMREAFHVH